MQTLKIIIQFGCLIFLAAIALILVHKQPSQTRTSDKQATENPRWRYSDFEYRGNRIEEFGKVLDAQMVFYDSDPQLTGQHPASTNRISSAVDALDTVAKDGWQFVWADGSNFITRRMEGQGKHDYFILEYHPHIP